ncbi:MAG: mannose-1-phosphate guanylyltransferase, partial [Kiritimatiellia bacterium]|nr:mannose-1-phosphate guanylyltransferase [Kiritimatiellia bacterium]
MNMDYAVILAGGRGERFWPLSTRRKPKQVLSLLGGKTFLQKAVDRLEGLIPPERILLVTSRDLKAACAEAAPEIPCHRILGEPVGRDTGAAIALAAGVIRRENPEAVFCVLTADHEIPDVAGFQRTLRAAFAEAREREALVTLGIRPTEPSSAYGYIEAGPALPARDGIAFFQAKRFVEKPDIETAKSYLKAGTYSWNSGMFIWSLRALDAALRDHAPHLAELADRVRDVEPGEDLDRALDSLYPALPKISIDYALLEKARKVTMVRAEFAWDDLGSWPALDRHLPPDARGNRILGACEALDATENIVVSNDRL